MDGVDAAKGGSKAAHAETLGARPGTEAAAPWIGRTLAGRYYVERFLGSGGFADVFAAKVVDSNQNVAIKILHPDVAKSEDGAVRFRQEAQFISLIAHPNIVSVQDYGTVDDGTPYMVMELLEGESVGEVLERQVIEPMLAFRIAMEACEGLAAAHERGVIHRDVKPDNLFLEKTREGALRRVKVLDLGVAKLVGGALTPNAVTKRGMLCGTPDYMAPEQIAGGRVGEGADVYGLTCVLWAMLLGAPPFKDSTVIELLGQHTIATPEWPDDLAQTLGVPSGTKEVLLRGLAKDPGQRPASMLELQAEIAGLMRGMRQASRVPPPVRHSPPAKPKGGSRDPDTLPELSAAPPEQASAGTVQAQHGVSARPPASVQALGAVRPSGPAPAEGSRRALRRVRMEASQGGADEIGVLVPDVYWVGQRHGASLECNPYLRVFTGKGREASMLIGPGPEADLDTVKQKVVAVIGSLERLSHVFVHHEAPDLAGGVVAFMRSCPNAQLLCSADSWRLARFYGIDSGRVTLVDAGAAIDVCTGHRVEVVPGAFCPTRGAVMLYDPEARVLFSGALFGGAKQPRNLVASEASWAGIRLLHETLMPGRKALRLAVRRVRRLAPPPLAIAPQHGAAAVGVDVKWLLERVERLPVGLDLFE